MVIIWIHIFGFHSPENERVLAENSAALTSERFSVPSFRVNQRILFWVREEGDWMSTSWFGKSILLVNLQPTAIPWQAEVKWVLMNCFYECVILLNTVIIMLLFFYTKFLNFTNGWIKLKIHEVRDFRRWGEPISRKLWA